MAFDKSRVGRPALEVLPSVPTIEEMYERCWAPMVQLARLLVTSPDVAADVVQDAFVQVHRHWSTIRTPEAYLRRTVVNGCRSHHRRQSVAHNAPILVAEPSTLGAEELLDVMSKLRYRERAAVVLRYYEDLPDAEIATLLDVRVGSVASLVHRALARLRVEIEG